MSTRAKTAAALASLGVLGIGWATATASGDTLALNPTTSGSTDTTERPTSPDNSASPAPRSTPSSDATSTAATAAYADGTYTGTTETHRFGSVTVTTTIVGGAISDVSAQVVSDGDHHSDRINAQAVPMMRDAVISANSGDVSTISGATYTTRAYLSSLQSALDQAAS
ncbi:MAG: FMN-binding protein [Propioniciclava sp.]